MAIKKKGAPAAPATTEKLPAAEYMDPKVLIPWDKNPRKNQPVDEVMKSIKKFGFAAPIIVRKSNMMVIAGHTRLAAAMKLGLTEVPVRVLDITQKQAEAMAIADNKLGEKADWDDKMLSEVLASLQTDIDDLSILGMEASELATLLAQEPEIIPDAGGEGPGAAHGGAGGPARPEGEPSHVRMVQLFFDTTTQPLFAERCRVLAEKYGTANITDTVFKAVEEAHAQRSSTVAAE